MTDMQRFYVQLQSDDAEKSARLKAITRLSTLSLEETEQIKGRLVWTLW